MGVSFGGQGHILNRSHQKRGLSIFRVLHERLNQFAPIFVNFMGVSEGFIFFYLPGLEDINQQVKW